MKRPPPIIDKKYEKPKPEYKCSSCGNEFERMDLTVKAARFQTFGTNSRVLKSRVLAWLCDTCLTRDVDWNRDSTKGGIPVPPGSHGRG